MRFASCHNLYYNLRHSHFNTPTRFELAVREREDELRTNVEEPPRCFRGAIFFKLRLVHVGQVNISTR